MQPVIGDFRSLANNQPREDPPTNDEAPAATDADTKTAVEAVQKATEDEIKLTPAERYKKRLAAMEIDPAEAEGIFDAVLSKGYYDEYVHLGKTNKRAVFRTRQYEDTLRLQRALELERPGLNISQDDLITRYNLAASLYEWDGKDLEHETEKDFEELLKLVRRLPAPVYSLLTNELAKFDRKTMVVFSDGAVENFS